MRLRTCLILLVLPALAGCGDYHPWGSAPATTPPAPTCSVRSVPTPTPYDPFTNQRPPSVHPGWRWIVVHFEVRALQQGKADRDFCVPVGVHLYGRMSNEAQFTANGRPVPLPYTASKVTPWTGDHIVIQYDPQVEPAPPYYDLELIATYLSEQDNIRRPGDPAMALRCAMRIGANAVAQDIKADTGQPGGQTVVCRLHHNFFNVV